MSTVQIIVTQISRVREADLNGSFDTVLVLTDSEVNEIFSKSCFLFKLRQELSGICLLFRVRYYVFISRRDQFLKDYVLKDIENFCIVNVFDIGILIPYISPPKYNLRIDGQVESFIVSKPLLDGYKHSFLDNSFTIFYIVNKYLNSTESGNIEVIQVGKPSIPKILDRTFSNNWLNESTLHIPHKGAISDLNRCVAHLNITRSTPQLIEVAFDDYSYKKFDWQKFKNIRSKLRVYRNKPLMVGPFIARQHLVEKSNQKYVFLQDSDDLSSADRFEKSIYELNSRNLDVLGCHELRIDQIEKKLLLIRFPIDVNLALRKGSIHPILHGTCVMRKLSFLRVGGYSTDGRFGLDTQFLLRVGFDLRIGNIDEFLYFRFRRRYSLTTSSSTGDETILRKFLLWRWRVDFEQIVSGNLRMTDSSLRISKHQFDFRMVEICKHVKSV